jgi:hypothetical protein
MKYSEEKKQEGKQYQKGRYERICALEWDVRELEKKVVELEKQLRIVGDMVHRGALR